MKRHNTAALFLLLLLSPLLAAQSLTFGEPFPLANTRYGTTGAAPMVVWNGKDFFVFWQRDTNLRVTKLVPGEQRTGRHVANIVDRNDHVAVTWTGTHFLVVMRGANGVVGQLQDANAEPAGGRLPIVDGALVGAAASNGETVLVLYWNQESVSAVALTPSGQPTGVSSIVAPPAGTGFSAVASNGSGFAAVVSGHAGTVAVTFDGHGQEQSRTFLFTGTYPRMAGQVAIESDGRGYLAAWQLWDGTVQAAHIAADGSAGPVVDLAVQPPDRLYKDVLDLAWTGANWAVAYTDPSAGDPVLRVAYVHPTAAQVTGYEDAGRGGLLSLAAADGRVMMSWLQPDAGSVVASLLPLAGREPEPVTFEAARQDALAAASTADATLVLWNEYGNGEGSLRAGVRSADGGWVEQELMPQSWFEALAATDGRDFLVTTRGNQTPYAILLDATSRVTTGPLPLPLRPDTVTWTGTDYLVADAFSFARISRSGTVSPRIQGGQRALLALASNGSAVMALMIEPEPCIECTTPVGRPRFALVDAGLRPIGEPRLIAPGDLALANDAELVWDGTRFVAAWEAGGKVTVAEVPLDGGEAKILATFPANIPWRLHMAALEEGVAVTWRASVGSMVAVIRHDDSVSSVVAEDHGHWITREPFVTSLPNGRLGLIASIPQFAPPHHGSVRVVMRVSGAGLPSKPAAPRLNGMVRDGRVQLAWTSSPQEIAGYRLEYRIGDGSWDELDRWFDAGEHETTVLSELKKGVAYQFRIRAFNDAGTSEYSAPVILNLPKRRSVR